ncbi:MAG: tetratricopeptide repeat protein [Candidatus Firestonebacteria bacterium]
MKIALFIVCFISFSYSQETSDLSKIHYEKGLDYYKNSELDKAKAEWQKSLEFCQGYELSIKYLKILEEEKFIEYQKDSFNTIIKDFFENGLCYYRKGDFKKAVEEWKQALSLSPDNKQILTFIKKTGKEVKEAEEVKKVNPAPSGGAWVNPAPSGGAWVNPAPSGGAWVNPAPSGITKVKKEKTVDEKKVSGLYYMGLKYYKQGKINEAIELWEQVLKLDPNNEKARKNLEKTRNLLR